MSLQANQTAHAEPASVAALPGLAYRNFRGAEDYPIIAEITAATNRVDDNDWLPTTEEIAAMYAHITNCDPERDLLFAEINDQAVGFIRVSWSQEENGPRVFYVIGRVLPRWRRHGLGRALLRAAEHRAHEIAVEQQYSGEAVLHLWSTDANAGLKALAASEGYQTVRYDYEMVRPDLENIEMFPLPEGLEIRPVTPEQYRTIWDAEQEAFRDHWGFSPGTEADFKGWVAWPYNNPELWKIAWHGDQVAGQVRSFIVESENNEFNRKRGYTESISVRRPWRRRGLARALIAESLVEIKRRGMTEAALGVDAENPNGALRVYQDCGFQVVKTGYSYRKALNTSHE